MLQLNPPIPMNTPKGEGYAHILIDYGPESDLYWTVLITETGEIWTYANRYVRASKNITLGRTHPAKPPRDVPASFQFGVAEGLSGQPDGAGCATDIVAARDRAGSHS